MERKNVSIDLGERKGNQEVTPEDLGTDFKLNPPPVNRA